MTASASLLEEADQICGRTICQAIATAATVTTEPASMAQPANQAPVGLLTFFDHW